MEISELRNAAILFAVIGITLVVTQNIVGSLGADFEDDTYEANTTLNTQEANDELASWLPQIALVLAAGVILTIVIKSF